MSDNPEIRGGSDNSRVNTSQEHEVQYWTKKFNVSREELEEAVKAVGPMASDVEQFLARR